MVQTSVGGIIASRKSCVLGLRARYARKSMDIVGYNKLGISFAVKGIRFSSGGKRYSTNKAHEMGDRPDRLDIHVSISVLSSSRQILNLSIILCLISGARTDVVRGRLV
jgi:hypothetical protein